MKAAVLLAILPALASAAVVERFATDAEIAERADTATVTVADAVPGALDITEVGKEDSDITDAPVEIDPSKLTPGQKYDVYDGDVTYVGIENATNTQVFKDEQGKFFSLVLGSGDDTECAECERAAGVAPTKRELAENPEKRFFLLLLIGALLGNCRSYDNWYRQRRRCWTRLPGRHWISCRGKRGWIGDRGFIEWDGCQKGTRIGIRRGIWIKKNMWRWSNKRYGPIVCRRGRRNDNWHAHPTDPNLCSTCSHPGYNPRPCSGRNCGGGGGDNHNNNNNNHHGGGKWNHWGWKKEAEAEAASLD